MPLPKTIVLLLLLPLFKAHTIINVQDYLTHLHLEPEPKDAHPDAGLSISLFLRKYKYPLETHEVTTADGYKLTLHRIPHGRDEENTIREDPQSPKPAVLLVHGLLSSSMDWVNMGPGKGLGLILADYGYDVWLGNSRGNTWGRKHETLDPDDTNSTFWDFSWHEMGLYDLPAKIDYILETSGVSQISYVGHSQGTTQFFVLASEKPEYNDKINVMVAMAPVAYASNLLHPVLRLLKNSFDQIFEIASELQIQEILPHNLLISQALARTVCPNEKYGLICTLIIGILGGFDLPQWDESFSSVVVTNAPAGASVKQFKHYTQSITYGTFRQFNYGTVTNLEKYNSPVPPDYDLTKITSNVVLFGATNDWFASPKDVGLLEAQLQHVIRYTVDLEDFSHLDFIWAKDIYSLLNVHAMNVLNDANNLPPMPPAETTTSDDGETTTATTTSDDGETTTPSSETTTQGGSWVQTNVVLLVGSLAFACFTRLNL